MPQGTPVLSVGDGEVVVAKRSGAAGYYVAIRHGRSYTTRYMHLRKILVKPGQKVNVATVSRFPVIPDVQLGRICTMKYG